MGGTVSRAHCCPEGLQSSRHHRAHTSCRQCQLDSVCTPLPLSLGQWHNLSLQGRDKAGSQRRCPGLSLHSTHRYISHSSGRQYCLCSHRHLSRGHRSHCAHYRYRAHTGCKVQDLGFLFCSLGGMSHRTALHTPLDRCRTPPTLRGLRAQDEHFAR